MPSIFPFHSILETNTYRLHLGGWVLRHRRDQAAAEALLRDMHTRTGWNMEGLIRSLRQQWDGDEAD